MTAKTAINHRDDISTLEELFDALGTLQEDSGHHPSTIYVKARSGHTLTLVLQEETLTDGSVVHNLVVS